ncbi:hypothetical protein B0J13DRAFT_516841 [Dactylonectria estremocensis]|uniref:Rhodopsin domain-containing protein n=1 Tax=Dactylonectria estremocensis TaxID=1079267 RepID=A0A9P9CZ87_9HYPO|nr:hypothetical protein B0J13DRAFT_516841 [Dactylonectria estremocensis]
MAVDPLATTLTPHGIGLALFIISISFSVLSAIIIGLRCWVRIRDRIFGTDDALMLVGWVLFIGVVGIVCRGTFAGIGASDDRLNAHLLQDGWMYFWFILTFVCCSLIFVKGSICVTLLRIAVEKIYRIIIWATLVVSCISPFIVIIGLMAICRPISANWDRSAGECSPPIVITGLSYLVSATSVATDLICAILPGFMLYKAQMKRATKISITIILGLGVLASIATIIRLAYTSSSHGQPKNILQNVGKIFLCSVFELGFGIIAGSLPSLRRLLKGWINFGTTKNDSPAQITSYRANTTKGRTSRIGTNPGSRRFHTTIVTNGTGDRDWERLDDPSSDHITYATETEVDLEMRILGQTGTLSGSKGSTEELRKP